MTKTQVTKIFSCNLNLLHDFELALKTTSYETGIALSKLIVLMAQNQLDSILESNNENNYN